MKRDMAHALGAAATALGLVVLGAWTLAHPAHLEAQTLRDEAAVLRTRITEVGDLTARRSARQRDRNEALVVAAREMKRIPVQPDIAGLMRRLSLPVDGDSVLDQTFTAGVPRPAIEPRESRTADTTPQSEEQALPLTVELVSRFDAAFALVRSAERLSRLVRIRAIRLTVVESEGGRVDRAADPPMVTASVDLDVIYDPTGGSEADR